VTAATTGSVPEWIAPLGEWLVPRVAGARAVTVDATSGASSGFSAETVIVDCTVEREAGPAAERYVVRRESPDPPIYPVQVPGWKVEIELQYRVMDALARHSRVPVAPLLGYEPDPSRLGAPFFVMGHVAGEVPVESPPYPTEGFFVDASPAERRALIERGLSVVAAVHDVDWRAAGLDWLVAPGTEPGVDAQLALWEAYGREELRGREHPLMERGFAWLRAHPPDASDVGLCWGDPRPGNMIWQDFHCRCATDFEAAAIAPPELDLGWWLMFDRTMHEPAGGARLPGDPTRDEQLAMYERASGRTVRDVRWYEICAAVRYCAIVVRVMNRAVERGLMPPDHTIWLENPATTVLDELFAEGP
jgi:aminoglycoside phosphotransferase (APT) family kinase protein